jgi:ABC-type nitrate/sulfonate/bicarbonate transport system permease component/ABC-type nitrate/sulfonate/bicarbonate transport system ATPase subunit
VIKSKFFQDHISRLQKDAGKKIQGLFVVFFWLMVWQIITFIVKEPVLLQGPMDVFLQLINDLQTKDFYWTIVSSFVRMISGFFIGLMMGILLGGFGFFVSPIKMFVEPLVTVLKAIPIVSYVILILIWSGSSNLSVYMGILVVFPVVYTNILVGFENVDNKMLDLCTVYGLGIRKKYYLVYRPAIWPHLNSALKISVGMGFKAAVAAEVIGTPEFSIGEKIYMAKIHFQTAEIFSWTIVLILFSYVFEKIVLFLLNKETSTIGVCKNLPGNPNLFVRDNYNPVNITLKHVKKSYGEQVILSDCNLVLQKSGTFCIMGESGFGKTTLLHLICGLIKVDGGTIEGPSKNDFALVFQENRLLLDKTPIENIALVLDYKVTKDQIKKELRDVLPENALDEKIGNLSGGMARRVAIVRGMMSDKPIVLMDEPFSGLDMETKRKVILYMLKKKGDRTLILSTHQKEDVQLLQGEVLYGDESGFNWNYGRAK